MLENPTVPAEYLTNRLEQATVSALQLRYRLQNRMNVEDVSVGYDGNGVVFLMVHLTKMGWRPLPEQRDGFPVRTVVSEFPEQRCL